MRRGNLYSYLSLGFSLFLLLHVPMPLANWMRNSTIKLSQLPLAFISWIPGKEKTVSLSKYNHLEAENLILKKQIEQAKNYIENESIIEEVYLQLEEIENSHRMPLQVDREDLLKRLNQSCLSVDAKVIFREPGKWGSFIWVNKGKSFNKKCGFEVIGKNSPVVIGDSLIGIVEEVKKNRSKVRLITDQKLSISVATKRDSQSFLSRGEVAGSIDPLSIMQSDRLKGSGFHPLHNEYKHDENLFHIGDMVVTSGLDGIFPSGLRVGYIEKIKPILEGGYSYDLEITPSAGSLQFFRSVTILDSSLIN